MMRKVVQAVKSYFAKDHRSGPTIVQMAVSHALDRRANARVRYPRHGAIPPLPVVHYGDFQVNVADISAGGLCIVDYEETLGREVGNSIELKLLWPDYQALVWATIVGASTEKRHIQFANVPGEALERIKRAVQSGSLGQRFRLTGAGPTELTVNADEIWLNPSGESLIFYPSDIRPAEIFLRRERYVLRPDSWPKAKTTVHKTTLAQIILCLANFQSPSRKVRDLTGSLYHLFQNSKGEP